jgi:Tol biopolymer transport system component
MAKTKHFGPLAAAAGALAAVGLLVLMLVVVEARPAGATFPGQNGKIAYAGFDGADLEIYTINPDGTGKFQVTTNNTSDFRPDYSPNANRIAYAGLDGDQEIYTIPVGGGTPFNVTNNTTEDSTPSYLPNGKRIAYRGFDGTDEEIYTIKATGGPRSPVTNNNTGDFDPDSSPSGKRIAYEGWDGNDFEIYTIKLGGGGTPFKVTDNITGCPSNSCDQDPSYHPNGQRIAYSGWDGTDYEIYTINANGTGKFQVTTNNTNDFRPDYSPNGQKIAYEGFDGDREIYTIPVGGGTPFNVTNNLTDDGDPSWGSQED